MNEHSYRNQVLDYIRSYDPSDRQKRDKARKMRERGNHHNHKRRKNVIPSNLIGK